MQRVIKKVWPICFAGGLISFALLSPVLLDIAFRACGHPGAGSAFSQETTPPSNVGEKLIPVGNEAEISEPTAGIKIPAELTVGQHVQAELTGISLDDVARGRVTLEIYPKDSVTVFSNISFISRKPEIILFPRKPGEYWLVFVLHNERTYNYLDVPFTVTGAAE